MSEALDTLLQQPQIWRGQRVEAVSFAGSLTTGFKALDVRLPGGGWPLGALTELLHDRPGVGELGLLLPALARLSQQQRWVVWIAPPYLPYAPALASQGIDLRHLLLVHARAGTDCLWAAEQALRSGTCSAVVVWPERVDARSLRRLQLAAETSASWAVLFRPGTAAAQPSPAALRLCIEAAPNGTWARILKCRGGRPSGPIILESGPRPPVC